MITQEKVEKEKTKRKNEDGLEKVQIWVRKIL